MSTLRRGGNDAEALALQSRRRFRSVDAPASLTLRRIASRRAAFRDFDQRQPRVLPRTERGEIRRDDLYRDRRAVASESRGRAITLDRADLRRKAPLDDACTRGRLVLENQRRPVLHY